MNEEQKGLYNKFNVSRHDGKDAPGGPKNKARYFVLDYVNDPFAWPALVAYAESCQKEEPNLAADLNAIVFINSGVKAAVYLAHLKAGIQDALASYAESETTNLRTSFEAKEAECQKLREALNGAIFTIQILTSDKVVGTITKLQEILNEMNLKPPLLTSEEKKP